MSQRAGLRTSPVPYLASRRLRLRPAASSQKKRLFFCFFLLRDHPPEPPPFDFDSMPGLLKPPESNVRETTFTAEKASEKVPATTINQTLLPSYPLEGSVKEAPCDGSVPEIVVTPASPVKESFEVSTFDLLCCGRTPFVFPFAFPTKLPTHLNAEKQQRARSHRPEQPSLRRRARPARPRTIAGTTRAD